MTKSELHSWMSNCYAASGLRKLPELRFGELRAAAACSDSEPARCGDGTVVGHVTGLCFKGWLCYWVK